MKNKINPITILIIGTIISVCIALSGCGKDNSTNPSDENEFSVFVILDTTIVEKDFADMTPVTFEEENAIRISDFIDIAVEEDTLYQLYAYRIIGSDGFYAHTSPGYPDNSWEEIQMGYLLTANRNAVWEPSLELVSRYFVDDVDSIRFIRQFDIVSQTDTTPVKIEDVPTVLLEDTLCIKLTDIVLIADSQFVPDTSATYTLIAADGFSVDFSGVEFDTGYWSLVSQKTKFVPDLGGSSRIKGLESITIP
jgi:hypothetical protein